MWDWQDGWILQSVAYAGSGDLTSVIAHADAINVDIPSREQIERSVRRIAAAGLVEPDGTRVHATRSGKKIVRRSGRWFQGVREVAPRIAEALQQDVPFPVGLAEWTLSQDDWQAAYDRYAGPKQRNAPA